MRFITNTKHLRALRDAALTVAKRPAKYVTVDKIDLHFFSDSLLASITYRQGHLTVQPGELLTKQVTLVTKDLVNWTQTETFEPAEGFHHKYTFNPHDATFPV